jgi:hypothetical protein
MHEITDATESARTILLGLNRGKYYPLPHVIKLMQADYDELFPVHPISREELFLHISKLDYCCQ